ncbi:MAG TPA: lysylphosphatidylglycerol synthase transmembrane domain-containing protein [Candidatus Bathyarchaeia archaeon]|nr:lysylphosphatidylglycerol synthase transmembrane domain-containing protein [Candidatus Bathyarchaeia archaeon]
MSLGKYLSIRKSFFFMIVGAIVFLVYLYFFVGLGEILPVLQRIDYVRFLPYYVLALVFAACSLFLYSASWKKLLDALSIKISWTKAFQYHSVGNFVDLMVPCETICGEVVRVQLVYEEGGRENYGRILSSTFVNRIQANMMYVGGLSVGALVILFGHSSMLGYLIDPLLIFMIGTVIYNVVLIYMIAKPGTAKKLFSGFLRFAQIISLKRFKRDRLLARAEGPLRNFETGFQLFRENPKKLIMPTILLFLSWVCSILSFFLVFFALNFLFLPVYFYLVGFSLVISIQGIIATLSVGALDIFMTQFLSLYKISIGASGVAVLLVRFVIFWFPIILGYGIIQYAGARTLLSASSDQKKK